MCSHNAEGAMGLVINKPYPGLTFPNLLGQLGIEPTIDNDIIVRLGGPVETGRGFVLHSTDYMRQGSVAIARSEAHTSELQSLMRISYAALCFTKKNSADHTTHKTY